MTSRNTTNFSALCKPNEQGMSLLTVNVHKRIVYRKFHKHNFMKWKYKLIISCPKATSPQTQKEKLKWSEDLAHVPCRLTDDHS